MIQAIRRSRRTVSNHSLLPAVSAIIVLALWVLISSYANLAKVSDQTIPKIILPLTDADFNGLVARLQPLMNFQSLRSSRVQIGFIDEESSERYRNADAVLALKRPDNIYLKIQVPVTGSKVAEMVSDAELSPTEQGSARVRRRFWFDRTDQTRLTRQQIFDERGLIATEVHYSGYTNLSTANVEWPSIFFVMRPRDSYSVRLTFLDLD